MKEPDPGPIILKDEWEPFSFSTFIVYVFFTGLVLIAIAVLALPVFLLWRWAL